MKLFHNPLSPNCRKVTLVQHQLGLEIESEIIDLMTGAHKQPEFLKLNPNGKVPVLQDGETVLWESNSIINYLASQKDNNLWPKTNARYDIMRWQFWEQGHWQPAIGKLIGEYIFAPMRGAEPNKDNIAKGEEEVRRFGAVLNGQLESNKFLTGDELTLADLTVAPMLHYREVCKLPIDEYKHLGEWFNRITSLDAWAKSAPPKM